MDEDKGEGRIFSLDELCGLAGLSKRTVRYYIQLGLVPRPMGEARGAYYRAEHLERLLRLVRLTGAGLSLEGVRAVLEGGDVPFVLRPKQPGTVEVRSHIIVAPGIEMQIVPQEAKLKAEQLREFTRRVLEAASFMELEQVQEEPTKISEE
jgi:DNA-binding transcriptional MerR regulator